MEKINDFITFYLKSILENKKSNNDKLPLYFSNRFRNILLRINDEISKKLINSENIDDIKSQKTYIDIDDNSNDKISFIMVNKIKDVLNVDKESDKKIKVNEISDEEFKLIFNARQRSTMKINRFITELFGDLYKTSNLSDSEKEYNKEHEIKTGAQKLEDFVNKFKSYNVPSKFELVKGDDIVYWYNDKNYSNNIGSLGNSCMSYERCGGYIKFYAKNIDKVSLLILKDRENDDKIIGRALVWNLSVPENRIFMDRIYTNYDFDVDSFKEYAKNNGWLYKLSQNMYSDTKIVDTINNTTEHLTLKIYDVIDNHYYPYMDTLKYYDDNNGILQNTDEELNRYELLEDTYGGSSTRNQYSYEQLIDMYVDDILNDFKYYVTDIFTDFVWDYVDDKRFISDYISEQISSYEDSIEDLTDEDDIINFLKEFNDYDYELTIKFLKEKSEEKDDKGNIIQKTLSDLTKDELMEFVDILDVRHNLTKFFMESRYSGYTAKELLEELYGLSDDYITPEIYYKIKDYIDENGCAFDYAELEDEDYLRDRFEN